MPNSRFALHGRRPSLIHGLCAIFASNSRLKRLVRPLLTPVSTAPFCQPLSSRFALHSLHCSQIHGLCAFFASNSRFMRLFQAALDTPRGSPLLRHPLSSGFALHGLCGLRTVFYEASPPVMAITPPALPKRPYRTARKALFGVICKISSKMAFPHHLDNCRCRLDGVGRKWGRMDLARFCLLDPVRVRPVPSETQDFKGFDQI